METMYLEATREKNTESVRLFMKHIEESDIRSFLDLFAEDGVQFNYFQCGMLPPEIRGKEGLRKFWSPIPGRFSEMSFPIDAIYPMADPGMIAVKYHGNTRLRDSKKSYNNEYFALFVFDEEGKIKEYHEYSNPVITAKSFDMVDKII
jgi:ketosteroid isomerase-like protein